MAYILDSLVGACVNVLDLVLTGHETYQPNTLPLLAPRLMYARKPKDASTMSATQGTPRLFVFENILGALPLIDRLSAQWYAP